MKNIQRRGDRKARHDAKANRELEEFFKLYASKVEIITYNPLDFKRNYDEYLVRFRLGEGTTPHEFLKMLIEKLGDNL